MLAVGFIVVGTTTACATKKFVRTEVDAVGQRVETLSQSLEATQEATRQNQARIVQVDAKADQVGIWAKDAQTSATTASLSTGLRPLGRHEGRRRRSLSEAPCVRSRDQRRPGQLQVRIGRPSREAHEPASTR